MVDVLRGHPPAIAWLATIPGVSIGLPGLVVMELLQGCRTQVDQDLLGLRLAGFRVQWPGPADCERARADFAAYRLAYGLGLLDSLIAHTAVGLQEELATFNVKHYRMIGSLRTVQPY